MLYPLSYGGFPSLAGLTYGSAPCQAGGMGSDQNTRRTVGCEIDSTLSKATSILLAIAVAHAPGLLIDE